MRSSDMPGNWIEQTEAAIEDPNAIWPEDVLTEAEWERGWFDRQVLYGRMKYEEWADVECYFGGGLHGDGAHCIDACKPTATGPAT